MLQAAIDDESSRLERAAVLFERRQPARIDGVEELRAAQGQREHALVDRERLAQTTERFFSAHLGSAGDDVRGVRLRDVIVRRAFLRNVADLELVLLLREEDPRMSVAVVEELFD